MVFEVRCQLAGQPDQLDIALAFALKASARRNAIEIAINVYLEQRRRVIAGPSFFQRRDPAKAKPAKIEAFNESVNRTNRIVIGHVVVKHGRENVLWLRSIPSTKPDIRRSRLPLQK